MPGDRLISVNGESMEGISKEHALRILAQLKLKLDHIAHTHSFIGPQCIAKTLKTMKLSMEEKKSCQQ